MLQGSAAPDLIYWHPCSAQGLQQAEEFFLNLIDTIMKNEITIQAGNGMLTAFRDLDQMLLVAGVYELVRMIID